MENIYWKRSQYIRFWRTCLLRGFTYTFIVRIIVQFLYQDGHVRYKPTFQFLYDTWPSWYKTWNNNKCNSKSPKKTRLPKSVVCRKFLIFHHLLLSLTQVEEDVNTDNTNMPASFQHAATSILGRPNHGSVAHTTPIDNLIQLFLPVVVNVFQPSDQVVIQLLLFLL